MKDVVIKDVKRKTNLDRETLKAAAVLAYSALVRDEVSDKDILSEDEEIKRRAQERVNKIRSLRNLSFKFGVVDAKTGSELDQVKPLRPENEFTNAATQAEYETIMKVLQQIKYNNAKAAETLTASTKQSIESL